ncbi:MAG: heparinase II/III family protein [Candidatus Omnitrophica bacterium]|nr:heparinase II/III family protein [Candidatus Omnitrophota bacterium]
MRSALFILVLLPSLTGDSLAAVSPWSDILENAKANSALTERRAGLIEQAREAEALPIVRRAHCLADVGKDRTWLDGRSNALEEEIRETFALAMSDFGACSTLSRELPLLAAAYRLTGEQAFLDRILAQLDEMARWSPLQRPGWTLYTPGNRLPPDGKDGNWLATGTGIRALGDTLELLPEEAVPQDLRGRIEALLLKEIEGVVDDWKTKRPWFVRTDNPITNQWVLPTEGLVRASILLGKDKHPEAYELGVANLLKALNAHGAKGEFEEGFGYASFTVTSLLHAAHAMAVAGDTRAISHPFLENFPTWLVHHFQPGGYGINCFDAGPSYNAPESARPLLSLIATLTASPGARWALRHQTSGPSEDLAGLAASALPDVGQDQAPPRYAVYERAARVNWRDSWDRDATGVWIRGGHPLDQHDHQDRGHVNLISKGRPILIEAGTPSYDHPLMMSQYSSGAGHNALQLGEAFPEASTDAGKTLSLPGWQKEHGIAPIAVIELDNTGGKVRVDGGKCYEGLSRWERTVAWDSKLLEVTDEVELAPDLEPDTILFRWHLGTEREVAVTGAGREWRVEWAEAGITLHGDAPLVVSQARMPDNTLAGHDGSRSDKNFHSCVIARTANKEKRLLLTTRVLPQ